MDSGSQRALRTGSADAEQIFFEFLHAREAAGGDDFEAVCARHAALSEELRRLKSLYERGQQLVRDLGTEVTTNAAPASGLVFSPTERYRELAPIAVGGMGAVVEVYDSKLRRTLAMKVVRADLAGHDAQRERRRMRLLNEAQTLANLEHPSIVPIYDVGRDERGELFFTMLRVRGRDLEQVIEVAQRGLEGWNQRRLVDVLLRVCEAMAHAHRRGIVHRDLKPANVMVGPFGEVYVMDWGLAKARGQAHSGVIAVAEAAAAIDAGAEPFATPTLTLEGDIVGTPAYMAPEQARGEHAVVGRAADIYAIGAILYRVLAGRAPYEEPGRRLSSSQVLARVLEGAPMPVLTLAARAPRELAAICERAMQREPAQRYESVAALLEDLRAYLEERSGSAWRDAWPRRVVKLVRRHPTATIAALALVVIGSVSVFGYTQIEASESKRLVLQAEQRRRDFDQSLRSLREREFSTIGDAAKRDRESDAEFEFVQRSSQADIARDLVSMFEQHWFAIDSAPPLELAQRVRDEATETFRDQLAEACYALMRQLAKCGAAKVSAAQCGETLENPPSEAERRVAATHPGLVELWPRVTALIKLLPNARIRAYVVDTYMALVLRGITPPRFDLAALADARVEDLELLAVLTLDVGGHDSLSAAALAEPFLRLALQRQPGSPNVHLRLARIESLREHFEVGAGHARAAVAVWPDSSVAHNYLGVLLTRSGKIEEGAEHYRRAIELAPDNLQARSNLASRLVIAEHHAEALEHLEYILARAPDDPDALLYLGRALKGRALEGVVPDKPTLRQSIAPLERVLALRPDDHHAWYQLGDAQMWLEDFETALATLEKGLAVRPNGVDLRLGRARVLWYLGRRVEAVERALEVAQEPANAATAAELALELYQLTEDETERVRMEELLRAAGVL